MVLVVVYQVKCLSNLYLDRLIKFISPLRVRLKHCIEGLGHRNYPVLSDSSPMLQLDDVLSHGEQESEIPLTLLPVECLSDCVVYQLVLLSVDLIDQFDE